MKVKKYSELIAWQKAVDLTQEVYMDTARFPKEEIYGLTSQLRRASVSIPSNIAEGQGRKSTSEFLHHLSIAYGSLMELETQLIIAERLGYLGQLAFEKLMSRAAEVGRLINGLYNSLRLTGHWPLFYRLRRSGQAIPPKKLGAKGF
ncbi:MAG: four helix bundle protein [Acidobacteria bacterium]|nr:MAG: four helix bundle protein [Acidobacteriota bacterium]